MIKKVFVLFLLATKFLLGQEINIVIPPNIENFLSVASQAYFLEDKKGTITIDSLLNNPEKYFFKRLQKSKTDLGFTHDYYWVKFNVVNTANVEQPFYLETARPVTNTAELYQINFQNNYTLYHSGDEIPFADKQVQHRNTMFRLVLEPMKVNTFYLKLGSDGEVLNISLKLWTPDGLQKNDYKEQYVFGLYYGIMIFVSLIYFFFYFALNEKSFIFYVLYVFGIGLLQFSLDGYSAQYLFSQNVWLANRIVLISASFGLFFLLQYVRSFLNTRNRIPKLDVFFKALICLDVLFFVFVLTNGFLYQISFPLINFLSLVGLLSVFVAIVLIIIKKIHVCNYFISAFVFLMIGLVIFILNNLNIIPSSFFTENGMKMGTGLEVVFLSFSMANKFGELQKAKEKAQAETLEKLVEVNKLKDEINTGLEIQVEERTKEIKQQNLIIEEKNKDITDSINYAKRIQDSIFPSEEEINIFLKDWFVFFQPKDIVSGDFYFVEKIKNNNGTEVIGVAVADCTGHGVPGAFMSMLGTNILRQSLNETSVNSPGDALDYLNENLNISLRQNSDRQVRDGMDIGFAVIDLLNMKLYFAGANNPCWIIRKSGNAYELNEIKANKQPIGFFENAQSFTNHQIDLQKDDCIYLFSDGYSDQFGGELGKKFKRKNLENKLIEIAHLPMKEQKKIIAQTFYQWKGEYSQTDDVCVIGIKV